MGITNNQRYSLIEAIHGYADNLMDDAGGLELSRNDFPEYETWRHFRDEGIILFPAALEMGRMVMLKSIESSAECNPPGSYTEQISEEFFDEMGIDTEIEPWNIRDVSPADLLPIVIKMKLLQRDAFCCDLCKALIKEDASWSIIDGKRQHIIKSDCKAK